MSQAPTLALHQIDHELRMVAKGRILIVYTLFRVSGGQTGRRKGVRAHPSRSRTWGSGKEIDGNPVVCVRS